MPQQKCRFFTISASFLDIFRWLCTEHRLCEPQNDNVIYFHEIATQGPPYLTKCIKMLTYKSRGQGTQPKNLVLILRRLLWTETLTCEGSADMPRAIQKSKTTSASQTKARASGLSWKSSCLWSNRRPAKRGPLMVGSGVSGGGLARRAVFSPHCVR